MRSIPNMPFGTSATRLPSGSVIGSGAALHVSGGTSIDVATADVNHDGRVDAALPTTNSNEMTVMANTTAFPAPPAAKSTLIQELRFVGPNGDGDQYVKLYNTSSSTPSIWTCRCISMERKYPRGEWSGFTTKCWKPSTE